MKFPTLILIFLLCSFSPGCAGQKEINHLSIVMAAAIDLAQKTNQIDLSVQIANAASSSSEGGAGGGKNSFFIVTGSGPTLGEAERDLYTRLPRLLYWNNMRAIIVSAKFAQEKMESIIDYLDRPRVFRRDMHLLVTPGKAKDILKVKDLTEKMAGIAIANIQETAYKHSKTVYPSDIHDFLLDLSDDGVEPILARIETQSPSKDEKEPKDAGGSGEQEVLMISGSAVFRDTKMVGWLNGVETRGTLWVWGEMGEGMFSFKCPGVNSKQNLITVLNQEASQKIKLQIKHGKPYITVMIEAEGRLSGESFVTKTAVTDGKMMKKLDRKYAKAIENEVKHAIAKTQKKEFASDVFGFGDLISRWHPKLWKKLKPHWEEEFCKLPVKVEVEAHIRRIGLTMGSTNSL